MEVTYLSIFVAAIVWGYFFSKDFKAAVFFLFIMAVSIALGAILVVSLFAVDWINL